MSREAPRGAGGGAAKGAGGGAALSVSESVSLWLARIAQAAMAFESRWTRLSLQRVDAELATRLHEQRNLWVEAVIKGAPGNIGLHGAAMVRGYVAATAAMEAAEAPDDAYQVGRDALSGLVVAIGDQKAVALRARERFGNGVIVISPDEIAALFASVDALKHVGIVKQRFPGAEITGVATGTNQEGS